MLKLFKNEYEEWCPYRIGGAVVGTIVGIIMLNPTVVVQPGERVVVTRLGKVQEGSLGEGFHLRVPFLDNLTYFDTRIQKDLVEGSGFSKDNQEVNVIVSVNWRVTDTKVPSLFRDLKSQKNAKERILDPAVNEEVKSALAIYDAGSVIANRPAFKAAVVKGVTERLEAQGLTIIPNGINIDNIDFSDEFEAAVEAKVVAEQQAQADINLAEGRKIAAALDADAEIETARGKAERARLEAVALEAKGGALVLQKEAIEKWDGELPGTLILGDGEGTLPEMILNSAN